MRAQNVCYACMIRKKGCDKALPACSFCTSRHLVCRYDTSASKDKPRRVYLGRQFVPVRSPPLANVPSSDEAGNKPQCESLSKQYRLDHAQDLDYTLSPSQPVEVSLHRLAQHVFDLSGVTCTDITDCYFAKFHPCLPVILPDSFCHEAARYERSGRTPPADFTSLLLAMLLVAFPAFEERHVTSMRLYTAIKAAISQAQVSVCSSIRLAQASLLIALREYTCVRPKAAYVSTMTCVGILRAMSIEPSPGTSMQDPEIENVVWGTAMLERLVLCEMDRVDMKPQTIFPDSHHPMPSDLKPKADFDSEVASNAQASHQAMSQNSAGAQPGQFGRQVQVVCLLDQLLSVIRLKASDKEIKLAKFSELDYKIRDFFEAVMDESAWTRTQICAPVAICTRLLFLLYNSILDMLQDSVDEFDCQKRSIAFIGLDMMCKMTLNAAQWQNEEKEQLILPICCFYTLREARLCVQERNKVAQNEALSHSINELLAAEEKYSKTWVF